MKIFKLISLLLLLVAIGAGGFYLGKMSGNDGDEAAPEKQKTLYTCGMDPQVVQDHPGNCPICEMKLTPIRRGTGGVAATGERKIKRWRAPMDPTYISDQPGKSPMGMDLIPVYEEEAPKAAAIVIDPVTIQNMAIRTTTLAKGPLRRTVRTVASIDHDETGLADVTTKFTGWIEKLYVDATGQQVHRGDPLFEIYSPDLYSAQIEYLLTLKASAGSVSKANQETARLKLEYWDISAEQIAELEQSRKPKKTLRVNAPIDGFVIEKMAVEGQMVREGQRLYRLADLSLVWVHAQIYEQDLPFVELGQEAAMTLSYLPDRTFRGRVTYVYPNLDEATRTVRIRMEFHNPGFFLKPGMYAKVQLTSELTASALLVPESAVLRSGSKNTAFVALDGGKFEPRQVRIGVEAEDNMLEVLGGLKAGERVVVSGQFMLDSESQLREAVQKMLNPGAASADHSAHTMSTRQVGSDGRHEKEAERAAETLYICPMPEHVAIEYDAPGKCPICEMTLVPVSAAVLDRINPGGTVEHYTCPMPEHSDIKLPGPGKCPRCRMTLIPVMPEPPAPEAADTHAGHDHAAVAPEPTPLPTLYTCPMASHARIVSDEPGKCPECEMKLVEISTVEHGEISEAHWREDRPQAKAMGEDATQTLPTLYTCPMASHAHIVSDKPGKCSECEMTLIETGTVDHGETSEAYWREAHEGDPAVNAHAEPRH